MPDRAGQLTIAASGVLVTVALVWLSTLGQVYLALAAVVAGCLAALVVLGPERLGVLLLALGYFAAPMNALRPIAEVDLVTYSDLLMVPAFVLLLPRIARARSHLSPVFLLGAGLMVVVGAVASLASADPLTSLGYLVRMLSAAVVLPIAVTRTVASRRLLDNLAWSYVAGQTVSTLAGLAQGKVNDRYEGLTTHPNFYGMCGALSAALCLYLLRRVPRRHAWVPVALLVACGAGVVISGSRAALLATGIVVLLFPLLERSGRAGYLATWSALLIVVLASTGLLSQLGDSTAVGRLSGGGTAAGSDLARGELLSTGWKSFMAHPFLGSGFSLETTLPHNGYLEIAGAIGVLGLVAYLAILGSLVAPVLRRPRPDRLGYVALAYCIISTFNNTLWDRFAWTVIVLSLASMALERAQGDSSESAPDPQMQMSVSVP